MDTTTQPLALRPFTIAVPDADLADLHDRLARTRFADTLPDDGWEEGTPASYLRDMVARWRELDWRGVEARLNSYPQFLTEIDGQTIHLVHVRSSRPDATPLLLTHTYPGSFAEFVDLIGPLTEPQEHGEPDAPAFHLVIPSLPGVAFSTPLSDGAWTAARVARTWDALMRGLGYDTYGVHGSDIGATIAREIASAQPVGFRGAHVLQLFSFPSGDPTEFERMTPEDYAALEFAGWFSTVNGYATMNASRPNTIAAALTDSPVGLLAYNELFENFGKNPTGLTPEQVLTQVSLYWLTGSAVGAVRYYRTDRDTETSVNHGPIGVTVFADDFRSMRPFAERDNTDIVSWTERESGGHFAAMQAPAVLAEEIRAFFTGR